MAFSCAFHCVNYGLLLRWPNHDLQAILDAVDTGADLARCCDQSRYADAESIGPAAQFLLIGQIDAVFICGCERIAAGHGFLGRWRMVDMRR
jgi:hypothetical protein